jgi:chromosomal replication initiator protein
LNDPDRQLWDGMLAHIRRHHTAVCRQWFEELEPLGIAGGTLNIRAATGVHRDYLQRACASVFNDAAQSISGILLSVRFLGPEDEPILEPKPLPRSPRQLGPSDPRRASDADSRRPGASDSRGDTRSDARDDARPGETDSRRASDSDARPSPAEPRRPESPEEPPSSRFGSAPISIEPPRSRGLLRAEDSLAINPDYTFDHFVVGPGNRFAYAASRAVADRPGKAYNPIFLHGDVGLGKTHLLQAICLQILESNPSAVMYYLSCESFITQFVEAVRSGEMAEFRHRFRDVDVLVVDDIHFLAKHERTQEEFFHTFNSLYQAGKQIVVSSDAPPQEIPDLEDRIVSRFRWGLVTEVEKPDFETRAAIIKSKAAIRGVPLSDDVALFVASRFDSNIRELEGALTRLDIQSQVEKKPIDLALARAALGDPSPTAVAEPSIQIIQSVVTDFFRVRLLDLQSKKRHRSIAIPRQICMALARQFTRLSLEEIGGHFGNRDHTTVMHAIRAVDTRRKKDDQFEANLKALEDRLRSGKSPA